MDQAENEEMWAHRGHTVASDDALTHHDSYKKRLLLDLLARHLEPHMYILEAGCGSGFDTEFISKRVRVVDAFDRSKEMIHRARRRLEGSGNVNLYVGALPVPQCPELQGDYDLVVSARVVCNLLDRERQSRALSWLASRVKPGGKLILFETMAEAFVRLGALCEEMSLEPVTVPGFNLALSRSFIGNALPQGFELVTDGGIGAYDVAARILNQFVDDEEQHVTRFREGAARLARALGDDVLREFSTMCYMVFENRSTQELSTRGPSSSRAEQFKTVCIKLGIDCPQTLDLSNTQVLVPSLASICQFVDHLEVQDSVLDMGCGIGILSALALTKGAREVTSVDISAAAVRETRKLVPSANVKHSDVFENVSGAFGSILFNAPWGDGTIIKDLDRAKFDSPGLMKRFFAAAPSHLLPGGDLWIQYGDANLQNLAGLLLCIAESDFQIVDSWMTKTRFRPSDRLISLYLYRLTRSRREFGDEFEVKPARSRNPGDRGHGSRPMMTTDDVERLVRAFLDIASGRGDPNELGQLLHPDYVGHYPDYEDTVGYERARQSLVEHRSMFPRRAYTLQAMVATPRSCACNYVMHLWHDAEYMGKASTGQELRFWVSDFFVLEDEKIRERWHQKDKHSIARQLAALKAPSSNS